MRCFIIFLLIITCTISDVIGLLLNNNKFCPPNFCILRCSNGYEIVNGCASCRCKSVITTGTQLKQQATNVLVQTTLGQRLPGPGTFIQGSSYHNPCVPREAYCILKCEKFLTGTNGCQYCLCDQSVPATTQITTTRIPYSVQLTNPCVPSERTCDKSCAYGYLIGPNNCQYCICSPYKQHITTAKPTTPSSITLPNACVPSQKCNLQCSHGYAHGPSGCLYCLCAPEHSAVTTSSTKLQPNTTMSEHCVIAVAICQVKCKSGFMTDNNDCTFCTCKSEIEKTLHLPKSTEPVIKLMKPCVQELDICNIFCAYGYLRGPDNCQFCACSH